MQITIICILPFQVEAKRLSVIFADPILIQILNCLFFYIVPVCHLQLKMLVHSVS